VYLSSQDPAGLAAYARSVSDPSSPAYRRFLSAAAAEARFGPAPRQVDAVATWLRSSGLQIAAINNHYIGVSGSAVQMAAAFDTPIDNYALNSGVYRAPAATPSVPQSLASSVLAVTNLDNAPQETVPMLDNGEGLTTPADSPSTSSALPTAPAPVVTPTQAPPAPAFVNDGPFSTFYGSNIATALPDAYSAKQSYAPHGYTSADLRAVYGASPAETGAGAKVAIIAAYASPTIVSDVSQYITATGGVPLHRSQFDQVTAASYNSLDTCLASDWFNEQSLDVEAVHALAPAADVTLVSSASCEATDQFDSVAKVVDDHLADIVSNSWSTIQPVTSAQQAAFEILFEQGAVEGIGFYAASGDNGDKGDLLNGTPDYPGSDPWVTSVGGTTLAIGQHDKYLWETGWGTNVATLSSDGSSWGALPGAFDSGTGGGAIAGDPQPFYQVGVVPSALSEPAGAGSPERLMPDIAADADPATGLLIGDTQQFPDGTARFNMHRIGGTSLATPVIAGIQALVQQADQGVPLGFANPAVYALYGSRKLHDPTGNPLGTGLPPAVVRVDFNNGADASAGTATTLRTSSLNTSLTSASGYDSTTGVGTPAAGYIRSFGF
jgi:subtilase family serine protease